MKKFLFKSLASVAVVLSLSLPALAQADSAVKLTELAPKTTHQKTHAIGDVININTATAKMIQDAHLKGIGAKRAEAIVEYREKNGPYKSVDDLKNITGITQKIIDANRDRLTV